MNFSLGLTRLFITYPLLFPQLDSLIRLTGPSIPFALITFDLTSVKRSSISSSLSFFSLHSSTATLNWYVFEGDSALLLPKTLPFRCLIAQCLGFRPLYSSGSASVPCPVPLSTFSIILTTGRLLKACEVESLSKALTLLKTVDHSFLYFAPSYSNTSSDTPWSVRSASHRSAICPV